MIIDDKLMRYVIFKKRTEKEVRQKCLKLEYTEDYIEEIIEYLKENEYINDQKYVEKYIQNIMRLKSSSRFEIKMDLIRRGVPEEFIEKYMTQNDEILEAFEMESASKLAKKRQSNTEKEKIKKYLMTKGYVYSSISNAIDNLKDLNDN